MIDHVSFSKSCFLEAPLRFEAGTQPIAEVIGFAAAVNYLQQVGSCRLKMHDNHISMYAFSQLEQIEGMQLFMPEYQGLGSISFIIDGFNINDIGILLDKQEVMTRFGHHCAMPIMEKLGIEGTIRISFGLYTNEEDIDRFISALKKAIEVLS